MRCGITLAILIETRRHILTCRISCHMWSGSTGSGLIPIGTSCPDHSRLADLPYFRPRSRISDRVAGWKDMSAELGCLGILRGISARWEVWGDRYPYIIFLAFMGRNSSCVVICDRVVPNGNTRRAITSALGTTLWTEKV